MQEYKPKNLLSLNGMWEFKVDSSGEGSWNNGDFTPDHKLQIPGSWEEQGIGELKSNDTMGGWRKLCEYEGTGWYSKKVLLPVQESGHHYILKIEGVRWFTRVWLDGEFVGEGESLSTAHHFDLSDAVRLGMEQTLVIHVDNRMRLEFPESHIHSYQTATTWGGITGGVSIEIKSPVYVSDTTIVSEPEQNKVVVDADMDGRWSSYDNLQIEAAIYDGNQVLATEQISCVMSEYRDNFHARIDLTLPESTTCWSDRNPILYVAKLTIRSKGTILDQKECRFGYRSFKADGKQLMLNGKPIFLRGYVDSCIFPQTGYPSWEIEHYRHQFRTAKELGFNHVRLHSWTPPRPFFEAADEEGMIVQTELPHWTRFYTNRAKPSSRLEHEYMNRELERILYSLKLHPSFVMLSLGNELVSKDGHPELNEMVRYARTIDATRLYTDNTGFGELPALDREGDFYIPSLNFNAQHSVFYTSTSNTTENYNDVMQLETKPIIAHEHGLCSMYIRPQEAEKYKGVLRANWIKFTMESLRKKGMEHRVDEFIQASGILQARSLKENFERLRRTTGLSGFQWLEIRDFPGQGHASTGILDAFWDNKGFVQSNQMSRYNSERILLMQSPVRVVYAGDPIQVDIEISNFGDDLKEGILSWELSDGKQVVSSDSFSTCKAVRGGITLLSRLSIDTPGNIAESYTLTVTLSSEKHNVQNDWEFWSVPRPQKHPKTERVWTDIASLRSNLFGAIFSSDMPWNIGGHDFKPKEVDLVITDKLNMVMIQHLIDGGNIWLMPKQGSHYDEVETKYLPILWNFYLFCGTLGSTFGMMIKDHPALGDFPHDQFSNWQWYHLVDDTPAIGMDLIPHVEPIIEVVDNFNRVKRLAYAFEVNVGKGKLFVSTFRMSDSKDLKRPENAHLFNEILNYVLGDDFQPQAELSIGELLGLFKLKSNF